MDVGISRFGVRLLEENDRRRERRFLSNFLQLQQLITDNMDGRPDFDCFRLICDEDTLQKLLTDKEFQASVSKYWTRADSPAETSKLAFSSNFERFRLVQEKASERERVLYQNFSSDEEYELKHVLDFKNNAFVKIKLDFVDEVLVKAALVSADGSRTKIKLAKAKKNKNEYSVQFNFLRKPELLLPLVRSGRVFGFFCKYAAEQKKPEICYEIREQGDDILIPNNHLSILEGVRALDLRLDFSYFLKRGRRG